MSCITDATISHDHPDLHSLEEYFPIEISSKKIWEDIISEKHGQIEKLNDYLASKVDHANDTQENPHLQYLTENIFPLLLPILEKTLLKAICMECLKNQKSLFNGIDFISERLWLSNHRYSKRLETNQNIFLMPWVKEWLKDHSPRPIFPKSWIWTKEEGAVIIQAYMRGHFIRKMAEVQEMRQFWKTIKRERKEKELENSENKNDDSNSVEDIK